MADQSDNTPSPSQPDAQSGSNAWLALLVTLIIAVLAEYGLPILISSVVDTPSGAPAVYTECFLTLAFLVGVTLIGMALLPINGPIALGLLGSVVFLLARFCDLFGHIPQFG